jgi:hypothetical protein
MEKTFIVLKDAEGVLRPLAFITTNNEAGKISAEQAKKRHMQEGDTLVVVKMEEISEYGA